MDKLYGGDSHKSEGTRGRGGRGRGGYRGGRGGYGGGRGGYHGGGGQIYDKFDNSCKYILMIT